MTIDEAIKDLEDEWADDLWFYPSRERDVARLSIEALKAWRDHREGDNQPELWLLPSETKE